MDDPHQGRNWRRKNKSKIFVKQYKVILKILMKSIRNSNHGGGILSAIFLQLDK